MGKSQSQLYKRNLHAFREPIGERMIDESKEVFGFLLVDPRSNTQEYITGGDLDAMKLAKSNGCIFVVEYTDHTRDRLEPEEIDFSLLHKTHTIHIVQQEIFVPMMNTLAEILEETAQPVVALASTARANTKTETPLNSKLALFKSQIQEMNERYLPNITEGE